MTIVKLALAALACGLATSAQADCDLKAVNIVSDGVVVRYDPFDMEETPAELVLRISANGCRDARLELAVAPEVNSIGPGGSLQASDGDATVNIRLLSQGAETRVVTEALNAFNSPAPAGRLSSSGAVTGQPLRAVIPYGQIVSPGRYRAEAVLLTRVIDGDGRAGEPVQTRFHIDVDVQASFRLAAGVDRRLFLGELVEGAQSEPVTFNAFSNVGYDLRVRSDHDWRMTLDDANGRDAPAVPYEVTLSGQVIDRSRSTAYVPFNDPPRDGVRNHRLRARALAFSPQPAGEYRDWITIVISPRVS